MRSDQRDWLHQRSINTLSDPVQYDATSSTWSWADFTSDDAPWFKDTRFMATNHVPKTPPPFTNTSYGPQPTNTFLPTKGTYLKYFLSKSY